MLNEVDTDIAGHADDNALYYGSSSEDNIIQLNEIAECFFSVL